MPFPNTIFDLEGVAAQYAEPASPLYNQNSTVYADACGWNNDPTSGNYKEGSGGNPGCNLTDMYSGGKAGGDPISTPTPTRTPTPTAVPTGTPTPTATPTPTPMPATLTSAWRSRRASATCA